MPVLVDYVRCTGLEARLFDCPHNGLENSDCAHSADAGVACSRGMCQFTSL